MFNPKYKITLTCKSFPGDDFVCLGSQLATIVRTMSGLLPSHVWYGADVQGVGKNACQYDIEGFQLGVIGDDSQLIDYCSGIHQFIWGEFLCIDSDLSSQNVQDVELETEDPPFRSIDCRGVLLEVRTFDTSWFEVYSEDQGVMLKLSELFHVEIEKLQ